VNKTEKIFEILGEQGIDLQGVSDIDSLHDSLQTFLDALGRIAKHEIRSDRRKKGMVDISEVQDLQRIAQTALDKVVGKMAGIRNKID